jgi:hypothetical protein
VQKNANTRSRLVAEVVFDRISRRVLSAVSLACLAPCLNVLFAEHIHIKTSHTVPCPKYKRKKRQRGATASPCSLDTRRTARPPSESSLNALSPVALSGGRPTYLRSWRGYVQYDTSSQCRPRLQDAASGLGSDRGPRACAGRRPPERRAYIACVFWH